MAKIGEIRMYLVPCSCGTTFSIAEGYDRSGTSLTRYLTCPNCGKRHDPKNRVIELCYSTEGYWRAESR
jgi:DNA-directed RNA polymerase subunit RPC12/RpoP